LRVVVTGAAGYLGRAVCAALRARGANVIPTDIPAGIEATFSGAPLGWMFQMLDVTAPRWDQDPPECVVNLAGISGVNACKAEAQRAFEVNAAGPARLWALFPKAHFVQASTASVLAGPYSSVYAGTKYDGENLLRDARFKRGPLLIFRLGTVFGTGGGKFRPRWDLPVHRMVKAVLERGEIELEGPECWRPLVSLGALADRVAKAAMEEVEWSGAVPFCSRNMRLQDVAATVIETLGRGEIRIIPSAAPPPPVESAGAIPQAEPSRDPDDASAESSRRPAVAGPSHDRAGGGLPSYKMPALVQDNYTLREEIKEVAKACEREFRCSSSHGTQAST